ELATGNLWFPARCDASTHQAGDLRRTQRRRRQAEPIVRARTVEVHDQDGARGLGALDADRQRTPGVGLAIGRAATHAPEICDTVDDQATTTDLADCHRCVLRRLTPKFSDRTAE